MLYSRPSQSDPLAVVTGSGSVGGAEPAGRWPPPRWGTDVAPSPTHLDRVSKPVQGVAGSDPPHGLGLGVAASVAPYAVVRLLNRPEAIRRLMPPAIPPWTTSRRVWRLRFLWDSSLWPS